MQTQGLSNSLDGRDLGTTQQAVAIKGVVPGLVSRKVALSAFVVGAAVGAWSGWALERVVAPPTLGVAAAATTIVAPAMPPLTSASPRITGVSRGFAVTIPRDGDYLNSASIPVAGTAFGRPHGPRVRAVHVELTIGGRVIDSVDIDVFSGRFAGVLRIDEPGGPMDALLRITDAAHTGGNAVLQRLTIDPR